MLGVNIGKNKDTPLESAWTDYLDLLKSFSPYADYLTINISSPNTVGLRRLQERQALTQLLGQLVEERERLAQLISKKPPLLVKLAPDLSDPELDDILDVLLANKLDGVIATNTTLSREGVNSPLASESGGLSGQPLFQRSLDYGGQNPSAYGRKTACDWGRRDIQRNRRPKDAGRRGSACTSIYWANL